jgi:hypothetical protein
VLFPKAGKQSSRFDVRVQTEEILWVPPIWLTALGPVEPTQTASAVIATQSAVLPTRIVAVGVSSSIGLAESLASALAVHESVCRIAAVA